MSELLAVSAVRMVRRALHDECDGTSQAVCYSLGWRELDFTLPMFDQFMKRWIPEGPIASSDVQSVSPTDRTGDTTRVTRQRATAHTTRGTLWPWLIGSWIDVTQRLHPEGADPLGPLIAHLVNGAWARSPGPLTQTHRIMRRAVAQAWSVADYLDKSGPAEGARNTLRPFPDRMLARHREMARNREGQASEPVRCWSS